MTAEGARFLPLPNRSRDIDDEFELSPLLLRSDPVADDGRSEAALRAQSQPVERNVAARLGDARFQFAGLLQLSLFRRDESQDDELVLCDRLQRFEVPRAAIVVLQQETPGLEPPEKRVRDRLVSSFGQPPAALISPSEMEAEGDLRKAVHDRVIEIDPEAQPFLQAPAEPLVEGAGPRIE